jgi:hypothetical protein
MQARARPHDLERRGRASLFLNTVHDSESEHDVGATLDAIRMLVEAQV